MVKNMKGLGGRGRGRCGREKGQRFKFIVCFWESNNSIIKTERQAKQSRRGWAYATKITYLDHLLGRAKLRLRPRSNSQDDKPNKKSIASSTGTSKSELFGKYLTKKQLNMCGRFSTVASILSIQPWLSILYITPCYYKHSRSSVANLNCALFIQLPFPDLDKVPTYSSRASPASVPPLLRLVGLFGFFSLIVGLSWGCCWESFDISDSLSSGNSQMFFLRVPLHTVLCTIFCFCWMRRVTACLVLLWRQRAGKLLYSFLQEQMQISMGRCGSFLTPLELFSFWLLFFCRFIQILSKQKSPWRFNFTSFPSAKHSLAPFQAPIVPIAKSKAHRLFPIQLSGKTQNNKTKFTLSLPPLRIQARPLTPLPFVAEQGPSVASSAN